MVQKSIVFFLLSAIMLCSCNAKGGGKVSSGDAPLATEEPKEEQLLYARLKEKADTAKQFCLSKGMSTDFCLLVDMSLHSGKHRMFVWDFAKDTVAYAGLCCHGYGKGSRTDKPVFSNEPGSYCTSLGKYKVGIRSYSKWGINVHYKLHGLEENNSNAFKRIVVLHSYDYVPEEEIYPEHVPLGYSQGCTVISNQLMTTLDVMLKKPKKQVLLWVFA